MEGMTQLLTKINRPYSDILLRKTMHGGGRRGVCTRDTPPAAHAMEGFSLALIGRRASVGGLVDLADWPCVLGAVDNPPGGVWIDFIRHTLTVNCCGASDWVTCFSCLVQLPGRELY